MLYEVVFRASASPICPLSSFKFRTAAFQVIANTMQVLSEIEFLSSLATLQDVRQLLHGRGGGVM